MMRTVTVLGAGTMGAQIAAHAVNAGFDVQVLDVSADAARDGMKRAAALRPDPFFTRASAQAVRTGGLDADLDAACRADWVIEAVVERLDVKQALFARVDAARAPHTIVTSNTSGIPIGALAEGRSDGFRRHFLGTHFFNPPRYLKLLELIPTPDTDADVLAQVAEIGDRRLGKGVVVARDTPNFIGNHIGLYAIARILDVWAEGRFTIEEIDAMTGPAIGRPKSATFRTLDITGLDVLIHVARNLESRVWRRPGASLRSPAAGAGDRRARLDRREGRTGLLSPREGTRRPVRDPDPRPGDDDVSPAAEGALRLDRRGARDRGRRRPRARAVPRRRPGRRFPAPHARRHAALHGVGRARHRAQPRRRRSRDALGLRLGARAVRDRGRDRPAHAGRRLSGVVPACTNGCRRWSPIGSPPAPIRSAMAGACRPRPACCSSATPGRGRRWSRATPGPAWSISATASSGSSCTRR